MKRIVITGAIALLSMTQGVAACDVTFGGTYQVNQLGGVYTQQLGASNTVVTFNLTQTGNTISGTANYPGFVARVSGSVSNKGLTVKLHSTFNDGVGVYKWSVDKSGTLVAGSVYIDTRPEYPVRLSSTHVFCLKK